MTRVIISAATFPLNQLQVGDLTMMAGIKTLDTSIISAIVISGLVTALHNSYFDKPLPVFLGIFGYFWVFYRGLRLW